MNASPNASTTVDEEPAPPLHPLERFSGRHPARTLARLYRQHLGSLALATFYFVIKHSPVWLMPAITAHIVDQVTRPTERSWRLVWLDAAALAVILVQNVPMHFAYVRRLSAASRSIETHLRAAICRQLQQLSIGYYARQSAGALQAKVLRDVEAVEQLTRNLFDVGLAALVNVVFALGVVAFRQPRFVLYLLVTVPLAAGIVYALRKQLAARNAAFREEIERMSTRVVEMTHLLPVTRAHGLESAALARVNESLERVRDEGLRVDSINASFGALSWATFNGFNMLCLVVAAAALLRGWFPISVGDVVLITTYFGLITQSVLSLVNVAPIFTKGLESIRSIGEVLSSPDLEVNQGKPALDSVRGELGFDGVTFSYPGASRPAVDDLSFTVRPGETVALVGPSGAGKSTVLNLAIGFIRPTRGRVLVDGKPMDGYDLRSYRRFLSVVPQESILFDGTVRENVAYGLGPVSPRALEQALRDANAWEFVQALPEGLETRLGEKGARLSGGQKQRLAIARALVRNPRVLILDEATSALDTDTEEQIREALGRLRRGRTTLVVAHRLSTVRDAHRIVVLEGGRVVETGTHDQLIAAGGLYARYQLRQSGAAASAILE
ncbi:MAG TPA: ABC transporter ATP-binding protein [Anaeromyxobacter sp.]|nr:ABC transporter ATP-binding protein [Anaeromyxobacter sp.]